MKRITIGIVCLLLLIMVSLNVYSKATNFKGSLAVNGVPILSSGGKLETAGTVWFVDSVTGSNGNSGKDIDHPLATIEYALESKVTSGKGDIVAILPGHEESIDSRINIISSNVYVVGMGKTPRQHKLTFDISEDNAFNIDTDNVILENFLIVCSSTGANQKEVIDVDASGVEIRNCIFEFNNTDYVEGINFGNDHVNNTVRGCYFVGVSSDEACVLISSSRTAISNCDFDLSSGDGQVMEQEKTCSGLTISNNIIRSDGSVRGPMMTWLAAAGGRHAITGNFVFDTIGDADALGNDDDLDYQSVMNYNGAANGADTVIDLSP